MIRTSAVPTREVAEGPQRLDAFYYAGGGRDARKRLEQAGIRLERLDEVAKPPYMGLRFARYYVRDRALGEPFLGPSDIQLADLSSLPLVSKIRTPFLEDLRIRPGWILISRSGVIGNFVYVREDMDGLIGSDDLIRIEPRPGGAPLGYVLTFLRSAAGIAMLKRSTYGAVIQHIEPFHVAEVSIPRLAPAIEQSIHRQVDTAAAKRAAANRMLHEARGRVYEVTGLPHVPAEVGRNLAGLRTYAVSQCSLGTRFEGRYHDIVVRRMESSVRRNSCCGWLPLSRCAPTMFLPDRGKWVNMSEGGLPLVGSGEMFSAQPVASRHVSVTLSPGVRQLIVHMNDILVARSGQIYSILGDAVLVGRSLASKAVTEHAIRVRPDATVVHPGFLYAFLSLSDYGYGQIIRTAYGTSIPSLSVEEMREIAVPMPREDDRDAIGEEVLAAIELRDQANDLEGEAQAILERALDEATGGAWSELATRN